MGYKVGLDTLDLYRACSTAQELTAAIDQVLLAEDIDATKAGSVDAGDPSPCSEQLQLDAF